MASTGQKNYKFPPEFSRLLDGWCDANAYDQKRVVMAAIKLVSELPLEDRQHVFASLSEWEKEGYPSLGPAKPVPGREASESSVRRRA